MFISLFLAVWVCLNMGSENMVLVKLLQLGAKNFTVILHILLLLLGMIQRQGKLLRKYKLKFIQFKCLLALLFLSDS